MHIDACKFTFNSYHLNRSHTEAPVVTAHTYSALPCSTHLSFSLTILSEQAGCVCSKPERYCSRCIKSKLLIHGHVMMRMMMIQMCLRKAFSAWAWVAWWGHRVQKESCHHHPALWRQKGLFVCGLVRRGIFPNYSSQVIIWVLPGFSRLSALLQRKRI